MNRSTKKTPSKLLPIKKVDDGIQFPASIQPRASKNCITGIHNECLKIRLASPPVDGAANRMCIKFLAKVLGISTSCISIVQGLSSRNKTIRLIALSEDEFLEKLKPSLH